MGIDNKYGRVTLERGTVGEDEPVIVFRAQDKLLPKVLAIYRFLCEIGGSPQVHLNLISATEKQVLDWQHRNHTQVPRSDGYQEPAV